MIFDDRALKVFLTLALVIGFAPIAKDSAAAVAEQAAGGFVAADSIVGGVADAGASGDATDALNEIPNEADADGISAVDEPKDEATDEQPVAGAADGDEAVSGDADATDAPSEEAIDSSEEAAEAPDDSADEDAAAAEESEFGPEGAPNSFRYVDGVPIGDLEISTFDMRSARAAGYPTWDKSYGQSKYVYINSSGGKTTNTVAGSKAVGIDVSEHQGVIDWAKVKADGIKFAIIRLGYGSDYESQDDKYFVRNVQGARANGIHIGVYLYSYATATTGKTGSAQSEANHVLRVLEKAGLSPSSLALPVYYDIEDERQENLSATQFGSIAETFCNAVSAKGYKVGIYSSASWWKDKFTSPKFSNANWGKWVAEWGNHTKPNVSFSSDLWQFTDRGTVNGISGSVDVNFSFNEVGLKNCWVKEGGKTYYYGSNGRPVTYSQWIDGNLYYFNGSGVMQTGWITWNADGTKSYFDTSGKALKGLQKIGSATYYFNPTTCRTQRWSVWIGSDLYYFGSDFKMQTGWVTWNADKTKSYFGSNGKALKGLQKIGNATYYFNKSTCRTQRWSVWEGSDLYYFGGDYKMVTGWVTWNADGTKSYFGSNGKALKGLQKIGSATYYFNPSNCRTQRWSIWIGSDLYYFGGDYKMVTGWITWNADKSKSYFGPDGKALKGFNKIGGYTYYFNPANCRSLKWSQTINGVGYYFDGNGRMHTGWLTWNADKSKSYFDSNGRQVTGWQTIGGKRYYFNPNTRKAAIWSQTVDGKFYYFNSSYQMVTGWVTWNADGTKSYFGSDGAALVGWQTIGGKRYYFNPATGRSVRGSQTIDGEKYYFGADSALGGAVPTYAFDNTKISWSKFSQAEYDIASASFKPSIKTKMDPASFPKGSDGYYQFARVDQGYSGIVTAEQINAFISSTAAGRSGTLKGTGAYFIEAAKLYNVNEIYLLAHAIHETGWGTSNFAKGYMCNGIRYYSFYGIGAFDSNPNNTQNMAVKQGWNSIRNGIVGGAQWISKNYTFNSYGQNTVYKMRWNYPLYKSGGYVGWQYATDPNWPNAIAGIMASAYRSMGITQSECGMTFIVPQYSA
ncbi:MAG: hypothetical protein HFJ66_01565 [Eggerthellaceae bacterium]|nr:hypothetical protein [Eggerthellaceae bacterium]